MSMSRPQKSALRRVHRIIARDLVITEDILGALREKNIFPRDLIEKIRNDKEGQVYTLLGLLEKRGASAFAKFVEILREDYPWLADNLTEEHDKIKHQLHKNSAPARSLQHSKSTSDLEHTHYAGNRWRQSSQVQSTKSFRDNANSPIQVIETPRRSATCCCQSLTAGRQARKCLSDSTLPTDFNDMTIAEDTPDAVIGEIIDNTEPEYVVNDNENTETDEDDFESGEVFYARARSESIANQSRGPGRNVDMTEDDADLTNIPTDDGDYHDGLTRTESSISQNQDTAQITNLHNRLYQLVHKNSNTPNANEPKSWQAVHNIIDELESKSQESDDSKMVQQCEQLFPFKRPDQTLHTCIQNMQTEKDKLFDTTVKQMDKIAELEDKNQINTSMKTKLRQAIDEKESLKIRLQQLEQKLKDYEDIQTENESLKTNLRAKDDTIKKQEEEIKKYPARKPRRTSYVPVSTLRQPTRTILPVPRTRQLGVTNRRPSNRP